MGYHSTTDLLKKRATLKRSQRMTVICSLMVIRKVTQKTKGTQTGFETTTVIERATPRMTETGWGTLMVKSRTTPR
jgi:hypothetical protein